MLKSTLALFMIATLSFSVDAQTCKDSIPDSHTAGQFLDNFNGTVTDVVNGVVWQKCAVGQSYEQSTNACSGTPLSFRTWQDALNSVSVTDGWRLPNLKELGSLVQRRCFDPAIDLSIFPSTPSAVFYSSTPDLLGAVGRNSVEGLIIDFKSGIEFAEDVKTQRFIRLMKEL